MKYLTVFSFQFSLQWDMVLHSKKERGLGIAVSMIESHKTNWSGGFDRGGHSLERHGKGTL